MTGGHDPFWGAMADGPQEVLKATRAQIYRGAQVIKLSATGGVYGRTEGESATHSELGYEEIRTIVTEAHRFGVPVAAHAIGREGIENCVRAGVDTIEHGHQLTVEHAGELAARNGALVPTMFVYRQIAEQTGIPAYAKNKARALVEEHRQALRLARAGDVIIGAGSDGGSPLTPHASLIDEVLQLAAEGLSINEALKAATLDAARILGTDESRGLIECGYTADLMLVRSNPFNDLRALKEVEAVWQNGRIRLIENQGRLYAR